MSDWVGILLIVILLVAVIVLAVVLFTQWQEQEQKQKRASEEFPVVTPAPLVTPVVKPRIVLRRQPAANGKFKKRPIARTPIKRKQILGNTQKTTTPKTTDWFETTKPGKKIKAREVKIDLDEIHRVTGIPIRQCPCAKCEEMRANVGS